MANSVPYTPLQVDQSDVLYDHGPDSFPNPGVRAGRTVAFEINDPRAFPGTTRTCWVHIPSAVDPDAPVACTLFQDGRWYVDRDGEVRATIVLDNLVHSGEVPPMVGVFVEPGVRVDPERGRPAGQQPTTNNRNREYDAADATYADFLTDEVLPQVARYVTLDERPGSRALCGGSSGGNAAFTAAWHRPDVFGRVIAMSPSFPQMPDGNPYPQLIAEHPRRPLKVLLVAEHRDLNWNRPRTTGSPSPSGSPRRWRWRGTTSDSCWGTPGTGCGTAASCCRTPSAGSGAPEQPTSPTIRPMSRS